jgi:predicted Fe-S protein YdhL (DUF1289 family)
MILKIDTPCIGICSTVYGDKICRGCKRQYKEVIEWNGYNTEQKQAVYQRLDQHMQEIVGQYLIVDNPALLKSTLNEWSIRHRDDQHPLSWALFVLRFGETKIKDLKAVGIIPNPEYAHLSLSELFNHMDKALFDYANQFN